MACRSRGAGVLAGAAVTCLGLVVLTGCSGSSSSASAPLPTLPPLPSDRPSVVASTPPALDPARDAVDDILATATVSVGGTTVRVSTSADTPGQLAVSPSRAVTVDLTLRSSSGDVFALTGPARVGTVLTDTVSVVEPSSGVLVDTANGDVCTVSYYRVDESGLSGIAHCTTRTGSQTQDVTVTFTGTFTPR